MNHTSSENGSRRLWQVLSLSLKFLLIVAALIFLYIVGHHIGDHIHALEVWVRQQGPFAPFIFTLIVCLLPMIFFPTDVLAFAAGVLFGLWPGLMVALGGLVLSAALMFLISRYLARQKAEDFFNRKEKFKAINQAINQAISDGGIKVLLLLRFAPVPFAPLSYFLGITRITFKTYLWTTLGTSSTICLMVYFGYLAKRVTKKAAEVEDLSLPEGILLGLGLIAIMGVIAYVTRLARRELEKSQKDPKDYVAESDLRASGK